MLLQGYNENQSGGANATSSPQGHRAPAGGLLDSPTLARVERAMLRHDEGVRRQGHDLLRSQYTQSLLSSHGKDPSTQVIKRGLLYQQRDKLFSRWKERYFVLTRDYLYCFRRASGQDKISEMGQFLFKVKLNDVVRVDWENKKTYSTVGLVLGRDGKIYLRSADGLEDWFELLEECMLTSKERRKALRYSHGAEKPRDNNNSLPLDEWITARQRIQMGRLTDDSMSSKQEVVRRRIRTPREEDWEPNFDNRLSLLTDIDVSTYDDSTIGTPSVTSYRLSDDVFCIQPPSLRGMGSFRSTRDPCSITKRNTEQDVTVEPQRQYFKFRERSYSDIQRV